MIIKKNSIIILSMGRYSDYQPITIVKALEDADASVLEEAYLAQFPEERKDYHANLFKFINWLINVEKVFEEVPFSEWTVGAFESFRDSTYYVEEDCKERIRGHE